MTTDTRLLVGCDRCGRVAEAEATHGTAYFWFPIGHTLGKVTRALHDRQIDAFLNKDDGYIGVDLERFRAEKVVEAIEPILSSREQEDTRVLPLPNGGSPSVADMARVRSFTEFAELIRSDVLRHVLTEERLTSHFQPIVSLQDTSQVYAHEALLRGIDEDGNHIPPGGLFQQARQGGLLFQLDLAARRSAIINAVRQGITSRLFVNFSPAAIYDPVYCLRTTVGAVREGGLDRSQVVFEVIESDRADDPAHLQRILEHYRAAGFRVALDDVGAGYGNLNLLNRLRPDYIKLDMELTRNVDRDPYKAMVVSKLLEMANELGIESIVEGIETQEELDWTRDHGAQYAQGYFIARPGPSPVSTINGV
jgi:EAL domain-containing protein (putative c-di-GMP-specific phosphodiesterase class I)